MKNFFKQVLSITLTLAFAFVLSVSVGAITPPIESVNNNIQTLNVMDFKTNTLVDQISQNEILDYSSHTDTTYDLSFMKNLNLPTITLDEIRVSTENNNSILPTAILDPEANLLDIFLPHAPLNHLGMPNAPYAGVVALYIDATYPSGNRSQSYGTGFLVSPTVMITAAHCVVSTHSTVIHNVRVYPFTHQEVRPDITNNDYITINDVIYDASYLNRPYTDGLDWAIVTLDEPISNAYYFPCTYDTNTVFQNTAARVIGYSGGNPSESGHPELGLYLYLSIGNIDSINSAIIKYNASTLSGNSGSPVIGNGNLCAAIHTSTISQNNSLINCGTRITQDIYNSICYIIETS